MTVDDVATLLELKPYTVKEYARRGILPGRKLGRTWRFLRPELEERTPGSTQSPRARPQADLRCSADLPRDPNDERPP